MSARATYTYAISRPFHPIHLWGVRGVDGSAVHTVRHQDVVAVVSTLPFSDDEEAAMRARLETPAELEAIARAHHGVVHSVFEHAPTIPFRVATIHHGEQRVLDVLRAGYDDFCSTLERLAGRVELGIKVYAEAAPLVPGAVGRKRSADEADQDGNAGREYLRRRRAKLRERDDAWQHVADAAASIDAALARLAVDRRYHRPQNPELSGLRSNNVLNVSYLLDSGSVDAFVGLARSLDGDVAATRLDVTGPWPPYSFAEPADVDQVGDQRRSA